MTAFVDRRGRSNYVVAFARMNPPTSGHMKLIDTAHAIAKEYNANHTIVVSHSMDAKKNPLSAAQKMKHLKRYSSNTNVVGSSPKAPTIFHYLAKLYSKGVTDLHYVAGSDRVEEFKKIITKYNGKKEPHGYYNFKTITVHSAGERDPDAEGVEGMSASKMREAAKNSNFKSFRMGVPSHVSDKHAAELMHDVRQGLHITEETTMTDINQVFEQLIDELNENDDVDNINVSDKDMEDMDLDDLDPHTDDTELLHIISPEHTHGEPEDDEWHDHREEVEEGRVVSIQQRIRLGQRMKRMAKRYAILRKLRAQRMAPADRIRYRSRKAALMVLRRRLSGGKTYGQLSKQQRVTVDQTLNKRYGKNLTKIVGTISTRLLPAVRRKEASRLATVRRGPRAEEIDIIAQEPQVVDYAKVSDEPKTIIIPKYARTSLATKRMKYVRMHEETDPGEYDYEGDMAINQLNTIVRHSKYLISMMKPDTNLPEWVQSKITLATDYIQTACDYMTSEMPESTELNKRDYAKEYANYQGTPEQIARRSSRNMARLAMGEKAVKGMDVGHKDNNPMNNDPKNLRNENPSDNRREPRLREEDEVDEGHVNIGGAKVKDDEKSILKHIQKTFPNVKKVKKDSQYGWIPVFEEDEVNEWTISDVELAMKKKYGKVDRDAIEKLKSMQHMGNVDRNALVKVGHGKLHVEEVELDEANPKPGTKEWSAAKSKGPVWKYKDARGVEHIGHMEKAVDRGGTDVSHYMWDRKTGELSIVSGSRSKEMKLHREEVEIDEARKSAAVDQGDAGDLNVIYQMRKVINLRGKYDVKWRDGTTSRVSPSDAHKAIAAYTALTVPGISGREKQRWILHLGRSDNWFKATIKNAPKVHAVEEVNPEDSIEAKVMSSLKKKAEYSGIDLNDIIEVYQHGLHEYDRTDMTIDQYAFAKVNSFIANSIYNESVAGPEKCWPGYKKVGTKPGTGRNTGKRVNDCEKIKEENGAGEWGTDQLRATYQRDTPGQDATGKITKLDAYCAPLPWEVDENRDTGKTPKLYQDVRATLSGRRNTVKE